MDDETTSGGALSGLRILDLSRVLAGPFATMMLADLGADVLKIERPDGGDDTRAWSPPLDPRGQSTYFDAVNRNKRSVALDLREPGDLAAARRLAAEADVLIENFRPGVLERFGLGYEELSEHNRGLVYCTISGFGRGLGAGLPGYDLLVQAVGGLMSITGESDGAPQRSGVAVVDVLTGLFATVGILAALRHRDATGLGQRVDVDLMSSLLSALVNQSSAFTAGGVVPTRMGNAHPSIVPYQLVPTAGGGQLLLAVGTDRQFEALCQVLGAPELAREARYVTNPQRVAHRVELIDQLERLLAARPAGEWAELLNAARVPAGEVNDIAGAFAFAERLGLDPIVELPTGDGGANVRVPRNPIKLSATPATYRSAPPLLPDRRPGYEPSW